MSGGKLKTIDLCAGIGGIRRAFEMTGHFENVLSAEIDEKACDTYMHLFGDDPYNDLTSKEFKDKVKNTDYDVLLAGFPCQSFSSAGKALGFSDSDKGTIFFHIVTIIRKTRPKALFLENVENLVHHDKGATFDKIITTLECDLNYMVVGVTTDEDGELTYDKHSFIRNSRNFGVPQNRPRVYIVAFDRDAFSVESLRTLDATLPVCGEPTIYESLDDVIEKGADPKFYLSSGYLETLKRHKRRNAKNGNNYGYMIVYGPGIEHPIANTVMATGGSGRERNMVVDVQDNIPGMVLPPKKSPLNDECIRFMTPREWAKLQGFLGHAFINDGVDEFSFPEGISMNQQYKQLGNSVTIPTVRHMADFLFNCLQSLENTCE